MQPIFKLLNLASYIRHEADKTNKQIMGRAMTR